MVEDAGEGVTGLQKGQRVVAAGWADGTWQQYLLQKASELVRCNRGISQTIVSKERPEIVLIGLDWLLFGSRCGGAYCMGITLK